MSRDPSGRHPAGPSGAASAPRQVTDVTLSPAWRSFTGTQGGFLLGQLLAAAERVTDAPAVAATAHFRRPAPAGAARVVAAPGRNGTTSSVATELACRPDGGWAAYTEPVVTAQVLTVRSSGAAVPMHHRATDAVEERGGTRPDDLEPLTLPAEFVPFSRFVDYRAIGPHRPLAGGPEARLTAWVRVTEPLAPIVAVAVLVDCLPPSLLATLSTPVLLATIELTVHLVGPTPTPGDWLLLDQVTVARTESVAVDDVVLTRADGALAALGRQTRRLPRERESAVGQGQDT